ncbi:MAG TPA: class I SAM-dependent methyltransferase [Bryobacteraceae bacterium]
MHWFENDEFWRAFYPWMFHDRRFQSAPEEVEQLLALSGTTQGSALDLCCGPARHSIPLAQRGFHVTAVDRSPFLLNKARERAAEAGAAIEFVQDDAREFVRAATFDLAINLFTSFGYFSREEDLTVLKNVRTSLKKGGVFILELVGRKCVSSSAAFNAYWNAHWEESADGEIFIDRTQVLPGWTRLRPQWLLVKSSQARRFDFELNLYSGQELAGALKQAGFSEIEIFGSLAGTPYDGKATRLAARAK